VTGERIWDLRLSGGTAVLPGIGLSRIDILVREGRIGALVGSDEPADAARVLDCRGRIVLPGAIDAHVHLGPNITYPQSEVDALPETRAAAAGGVTSLLAYLMSPQPYDDVFPTARDTMAQHSLIDFGFHFCVVSQEQLDRLPHYIQDLGVSSFKFFMNFRGDEGAYLGLPGNDDGFLFDLMHAVAENGGMVDPHAENVELVWRLRRLGVKPGSTDLETWCNARPDYVETEALQRVAYFAELSGASAYAVHTTAASALDVLRRARQRYENVFVETCPHYLTLDVNSPCGTYGKVNPPLRYAADRDALWAGVAGGDVDVIGSDHVPRHRSFKEKDINSASAGFPGLQNLLPLAISEGHQRLGIRLERIVEVTSTRPAQLFGLFPRKGAIQVGADADFAVVDLSTPGHVTAATQYSAAEYTPWEGWETRCSVTTTIVGGRVVYQDGQFVEESRGSYLERRHSGRAALEATR
jgi:dihydropyrimidinase